MYLLRYKLHSFECQDSFNIIMLFQDDDAAEGITSANTSNLGDVYPPEEDIKQNPNNARGNTTKTQKDTRVNEKARYGMLWTSLNKKSSACFIFIFCFLR